MRAHVTLGLRAAIAFAWVAAASGALAQPYAESPPWGSQARALTMQVAPPGSRAPSNTAVPAKPAAGGPMAPMAPQVRPETATPAQPPAAATRQPETRPKTVSLETARPSVTVAGRRVVPFAAAYPAGSLVIVNRERALYHVGGDGKAVRYPVAIGSFTEEWTGVEFVTDKKANPKWFPVQETGKEPREPVEGGDPANPLGARALYLGRTLWRIHGTPAADSIGQAVSSGCIRMHNDHVIELFDKVMLGTEVYVIERLADVPPVHRGKKVIE